MSDARQPVRPPMAFDKNALRIDCEAESDRIADAIRRQVRQIRRKGVVLGLSGGIDSSVTAALAARSLGPGRVVGICMPESDSDSKSLALGRLVAERYGIRCSRPEDRHGERHRCARDSALSGRRLRSPR